MHISGGRFRERKRFIMFRGYEMSTAGKSGTEYYHITKEKMRIIVLKMKNFQA